MTVTNNGNGPTGNGVLAYFVLPAGTDYETAVGTDWSCQFPVSPGNVVGCEYQGGPILPDYSFDFTVTVKVNTPTPGGKEFVAEAYVSRNGQSIGQPAVCEASATSDCAQNVFVLPTTWKIEKSDAVPALRAGRESTYTLTVTTNGDQVPTEVKDQLPQGMSLVSASGTGWSCSESDGLVLCRKSISETASEQISVKVLVDGSLANQTVTNYASVGPVDGALTPGPNCRDEDLCASNTDTVLTIDGLRLTKSDPVPPLQAGEESVYTLTFETSNPNADIDVRDTLPAGLTLVEASGAGWVCSPALPSPPNPLTCNKPNVQPIETITVKVKVDPGITAETVTNYAAAGPKNLVPDPGPACLLSASYACAVNESPVIPLADFEITKSQPVPGLRVGQESTYTLDVTTTGVDVDTEVKDLVPDGLTLVKAEGNGWFCEDESNGLVLCRKTISTGITEKILVTVSADEGSAGQTLINYASVGPSGRAPEPGAACTPDTRCAKSEFQVNQPAGYTISKSKPQPPLQVGQQSVYTLTVTTDGEDVVSDVKDQLPDGMSLVSIEGDGWTCGDAGNNLFLCRKEISSVSSETLRVTVNVATDTIGQTLINYASVGRENNAPEPGPACTPTDFTACAMSPSTDSNVIGPVSYEVSKSLPEPPLQVNKQSTYIITVKSGTEGVEAEVRDQLPQGMTLVSAGGDGWNCEPPDTDNLVLCRKTIDSTGPEQIAVTVTVGPEINNQTVTNYASTGGAGNAPQPGPQSTDEKLCAESTARVSDIRDEIETAVEDDVKAFLAARLDRLVSSVGQESRLKRFRETACGVSHDLQLSGEATSHAANLSGTGSFSMKGGIVPTADVPEEACGRFNLWAEAGMSFVDALDESAVRGGMVTTGLEYLFTENLLAGVRLSFDYTEADFDSAANSEISGFGWLAGPYISAEVLHNVFLDGFIGYGRSWNDYQGNYEGLALSGDFETQRIIGYLNLSGDYQAGALELSPLLGVAYGKEWSGAFDVHNSVVGDTGIDSQEAELARLTGRIEAGYFVIDEPGERFEVFIAPKVTYDMVRSGGEETDNLLGGNLWRGGLDGGFRFAGNRVSANLLLGYDGIGVSEWSAYRGELQFNYSW